MRMDAVDGEGDGFDQLVGILFLELRYVSIDFFFCQAAAVNCTVILNSSFPKDSLFLFQYNGQKTLYLDCN